jgi:hypothetical protein
VGEPRDDDGGPDPRLAAALAAFASSHTPATRAEVLAALGGARVFLALAARALTTEVASSGMRQERQTDIALLTVARPDGSRVLPAFSDGHAVQRWQPQARPLPLPAPTACATAVEDGAVGLLLDPGPEAFLVDAAELAELAAGRVPVPGSAVSTRHTTALLAEPAEPPDPALLDALADALQGEPIGAARLLDGPDGPVLGVVPAGRLAPADLTALADRVARRLGDRLPPDGLDLAAVPVDGSGTPVPLPRRRRRWLSARGR